MNALFDTTILIDYLSGVAAAKTEFDRHRRKLISIVTWMEVLVGVHNEEEADVIEMFLRDFRVVDLTRGIAREAVALRTSHRIKLPDAIVWASARAESALLVTRDRKAFSADEPGIRVPY